MSHKRPLDAAAPEEQEAPRSPRKRLRRTVLVAVCFARICAPGRRRARAVTLEQMVRQAQLVLMVLVARLSSMERLFLDLPSLLQRSIMGSMEDTIRSVVRTEIQGLAEQIATFQRSITGSIEDTVRLVLRTEMQETQAALLPNGVYEPSREISEGLPDTGCSSGVVKLRFVEADRPNNPLYTGSPVQWQNGKDAKVAIFQDERQIMDGDLSKLQIEILPVHADFFTERGEEYFTKEEFNKQIFTYKGIESVLATVNLKNGEAYLGSFFFKESSYNTNLRLAARVKRQHPADRVQEAITDRFVVKDRRSEFNEKSYLPSKGDVVHRLKKISQKGKYCTALVEKNITTVKHLMRKYHEDKSGLQKLTGMRKGDWSTMIKHASTCDPGDEIYSYRVSEENCEVLFNDFYDLVGMRINGSYIPARDLDQFQQIKVNSWKMSAYKTFEERENSGGIVPDYLMRDGHPVRAVPLNNEAGPSEQARMTWQYPTDMAAQHGASITGQQNGYLRSLTTDGLGTSCPVTAVELGQQHPLTPQNGTPYYPTPGNILNGQVPFSGQPTIPSHILLPVPGASLIDQQNGYLSSSMADAPGTSCPVTDEVTQGTSSPNHDLTDILSGLSPTELQEWLELPAHLAYQDGFAQATGEELPNSNYQFDDYEHDGGNQ